MNSKSVNRGQHTLHDTDSTEHIKHQNRVRNCFKPTQCFLSLLSCLGLPLFPACRKGRFGTPEMGLGHHQISACATWEQPSDGDAAGPRVGIIWGLQRLLIPQTGGEKPLMVQ